jgi:hypothetical protein
MVESGNVLEGGIRGIFSGITIRLEKADSLGPLEGGIRIPSREMALIRNWNVDVCWDSTHRYREFRSLFHWMGLFQTA